MQLAPSFFSASPYHAAYYPQPPAPQDTHLKRQYLALLPPQQIIEICLTFDLHVPPYIKSTVWPPDISAAIANLQNQNQNPPVVSNESDNAAKDKSRAAGMDSLKLSSEKESTPPVYTDPPPTDPQPPEKRAAATPIPSSTSAPSTSTPSGQQVIAPAEPFPPQPTAAPAAAPAALTVPTSYAHQPYSYAHPHATYPHAPYYPPPPAGYSYPYSSYSATVQNGYHHPVVPSGYPSQPTPYSNPYSISHPGPSQDVGGDDLPSYEEMIVEALTENSDPEGCAPKDLFTWMASRYPLQSNFRPSASQALQKAYKRGRFEKGTNGKYRLNATWEGGNTSRRTTRRPQIQGVGPSTQAPPASPFTHAPLVHHHHGHTPAASQRAQSYLSQPLGYSYAGYPGYLTQGSSTSPAVSTSATTAAPSSTNPPAAGATASDADTYEAAKAILNAINSGSLLQLPPEEPLKDTSEMVGNGVEHLLSQLQSALAGTAAAASVPLAPALPPQPAPVPAPSPQSEPRAELQAQLALLAAQLAELSQAEDTLTEYNPSPAIAPTFPTAQPEPIPQPPPPMSTVGIQSVSRVPPMQGLLPPLQPEEEEDSDDDDMEAVI